MAKDKEKKCVACLGRTEGFPTEKVTHMDGRNGVVHCNTTCKYKAEKQGWK